MLKKRKVIPSTEPPTEEAIRTWLITNIASVVNMDPSTIDVRQTFDNYGLDSLQAVSLSGDLETWLNREISPTVVWDYPTVEQLAQHLSANHMNGNKPAGSGVENGAE
ncbi:MAG TPA: acyl carrier protein [Candidatus Angelobacter sp.]|jgi:acyl carrier protein|nr:acyl carrier protein [Candidatus Angelobacter sp.]